MNPKAERDYYERRSLKFMQMDFGFFSREIIKMAKKENSGDN